MIQRYYQADLYETYNAPLADVMGCDDGNVVLYADHLAELAKVKKDLEDTKRKYSELAAHHNEKCTCNGVY
jgi:hypothetical protein